MQVLTTTVARILFGIPFLVFGLLHLTNASAMAGFVPIPGGVFWVYLTGIALIAAAVSLWTGRYAKLAMLLLAGMVAIFALTIHLPGAMNEATRMSSMPNLLKDLGLVGGALTWAGIFAREEVKTKEKVSA